MRTISKVVNLTKLRGYRWEVVPVKDGTGNVTLKVTETYTVTDDDYTTAPEGQQRREVALSQTEQSQLATSFRKAMRDAAIREVVDEE